MRTAAVVFSSAVLFGSVSLTVAQENGDFEELIYSCYDGDERACEFVRNMLQMGCNQGMPEACEMLPEIDRLAGAGRPGGRGERFGDQWEPGFDEPGGGLRDRDDADRGFDQFGTPEHDYGDDRDDDIARAPSGGGLSGAYWDEGGQVPNLYYFQPDGTGLRTGYVTGLSNAAGSQYPFAWRLEGQDLILEFPSGYTDHFRIVGYHPDYDVIERQPQGRSANWGPGPWYGCASGRIPQVIADSLC